MATLEYYLVYSTYKVIDGKPVVMLVGRTKGGQKVVVLDKSYKPYFFVQLKEDLPLQKVKPLFTEMVIKGRFEEYTITDVKKVTRLKKGEETPLLQVFANIPAAVPPIQKEIYSWDVVDKSYEYDIRYTDKYLIDKKLTPLTLHTAEVKELPKKEAEVFFSQGKVYEASSITLVTPTQTYEHPKVLAVDIETYNPEGKTMDMNRFPIVMLALYAKDENQEAFEKVLTWRTFPIKDKQFAKKVQVCVDEAEMLTEFGKYVHEFDPDFIVGYNSDRFDLPYIRTRAKLNKVTTAVGIEGSEIITRGTSSMVSNIIGYSHIDVYQFMRRVFRFSLKTPTLSLDAVSKELLGQQKVEIDINQLHEAWDAKDERCEEFAYYNLIDSKLTHDLLLHGFSLLAEITKVIGVAPFDVSRMSMSQMVEYFILNKAAEQGRLAPNKPSQQALMGRRRGSFAGGFVVTPKPGIYEDIAVFDFRSLYPTIIASHNISVETVNKGKKEDGFIAPTEEGQEPIWYAKEPKGFLSEIMETLILHRKEIKQEIKEKGKTPMLNSRSMALKYLCNSFYGYLGFAMSRWYSLKSSRAVTAWARHYIKTTMKKAEEHGFKVVYGDTDSVFLQLCGKSKEDSLKFLDEVNKTLPEFMELEAEGFFPSGLFVGVKSGEGGAKKRYALLHEDGHIKIAGFESVRRNTSPIAKEVQKQVIAILLKEKDEDKAVKFVKQTVDDLRNHRVPVEKVTIFTKLTKKIADYDAIGPHVAAAQKMIDMGDKVGAGSPIYYVVGKGSGRIRDKVRLPKQTTVDDYDPEYYINNQVLPAVEKIFEALGHKKDDLTTSKQQSSLGQFF